MADNLFDASRLYEVLKQYNLLPNYGNFVPGGGNTGLFKQQTNTLVAPFSDKDAMAHELTHAVQFNLLKEAAHNLQKKKQSGTSLTDQEAQYLRAAEQLFNEQYGNVFSYDRSKDVQDTQARKGTLSLFKAPEYISDKEKYTQYRTKPTEIQAHGVGRMSVPSKKGAIEGKDAGLSPGANPHLDPTMATEFDILFSMFNSLPQEVKNSVATSRQNNIQENRQFYSDPMLPYATDLFYNPFSSTIK